MKIIPVSSYIYLQKSKVPSVSVRGADETPKKRYFTTVYGDEQAYFKNGRAFLQNDEPYSGIIYHKDKSGNSWKFICKNGEIMQSVKNREVFKSYKYLPFPTLPTQHTFSDSSKLADDQFYNSTGLKSTQIQHKGTTTEIIQNKNAKYKNEPRLVIQKTEPNGDKTTKMLIKEDGEEKTEFKSVEEASEYFKTEYGIDAKFSNLIQAHVTKYAIDDFAKLNINNSGKKVFEGLKIATEQSNTKEAAVAEIGISYFWENNKDFEIFKKMFAQNKSQEEKAKFLIKCPPMGWRYEDCTIFLNDNFNWTNSSRERMERMSKHLSVSTLKGVIQHELGHILHGINDPYMYTVTTLKDTKEKENIRSEVSKYSKVSGAEFVAEYIAGRLSGKTYSPKVDNLYIEYGGPNIFMS